MVAIFVTKFKLCGVFSHIISVVLHNWNCRLGVFSVILCGKSIELPLFLVSNRILRVFHFVTHFCSTFLNFTRTSLFLRP